MNWPCIGNEEAFLLHNSFIVKACKLTKNIKVEKTFITLKKAQSHYNTDKDENTSVIFHTKDKTFLDNMYSFMYYHAD